MGYVGMWIKYECERYCRRKYRDKRLIDICVENCIKKRAPSRPSIVSLSAVGMTYTQPAVYAHRAGWIGCQEAAAGSAPVRGGEAMEGRGATPCQYPKTILQINSTQRRVDRMLCVDLDNVKFVDALRVAYNMRYIFGKKVWIDKTRKGYHVCCDVNLPQPESIKIRETLGDDPWRISVEKQRMYIHRGHRIPYDIIFRWKDGYEAFRVYEIG